MPHISKEKIFNHILNHKTLYLSNCDELVIYDLIDFGNSKFHPKSNVPNIGWPDILEFALKYNFMISIIEGEGQIRTIVPQFTNRLEWAAFSKDIRAEMAEKLPRL